MPTGQELQCHLRAQQPGVEYQLMRRPSEATVRLQYDAEDPSTRQLPSSTTNEHRLLITVGLGVGRPAPRSDRGTIPTTYNTQAQELRGTLLLPELRCDLIASSDATTRDASETKSSTTMVQPDTKPVLRRLQPSRRPDTMPLTTEKSPELLTKAESIDREDEASAIAV